MSKSTWINPWGERVMEGHRTNMIMRSFKKCGISNSLDGTEDDILWQDDDDKDTVLQESDGEDDSKNGNDEAFEDGDDPYDTDLSHNEVECRPWLIDTSVSFPAQKFPHKKTTFLSVWDMF